MVRVLQQSRIAASSGVIILTSRSHASHQARCWPDALRMTEMPRVSTTILVLLFITSQPPLRAYPFFQISIFLDGTKMRHLS
jgi:hypothetical protein